MWYVIQTITGKEVETVGVIDKVLKKRGYKECFVIQQEYAWRVEGHLRIHIEPLFPSYMFVETDTPNDFFFALKRVPKLTKLLGNEGEFGVVLEEEEILLRKLLGNDEKYIIRRSWVEIASDGKIVSAEGALKEYVGSIVKKRLRKRIVMIEIKFLGKTKRIQLGIKLADDRV